MSTVDDRELEMVSMKTAIVCVSVSHKNTRRVAEAMAEELNATLFDPEQTDVTALGDYDLIGFGSGIFNMKFHPVLREVVRHLPPADDRSAFVFATRGGPGELPFWPYMRQMSGLLEQKGYDVVGTFSCRGFDTWWPLRLVGGINKGRPNADDLAAARAFARNVRDGIAARSAQTKKNEPGAR